MKIVEAVVDSDMIAGNYSVVDDTSNNEEFELHSIHGNGKIQISKSGEGSTVACYGDTGNPANGIASTIRNYLTVQNIKNSCSGNVLQVNMSPKEVAKFILDFGTFSGFEL